MEVKCTDTCTQLNNLGNQNGFNSCQFFSATKGFPVSRSQNYHKHDSKDGNLYKKVSITANRLNLYESEI